MPYGNPGKSGDLAAAAVAALTSLLRRAPTGENVLTPDAGPDSLIILIQARFATSRSDTSLFASFQRAPYDQALQGRMRFALERSAEDDPGFRDELARTLGSPHPHDQPESATAGGTSNTTTISNSIVKGQRHNFGILSKDNRKTISLGLGGLATLALIGGGIYTLAPTHRHPHIAVSNSPAIPVSSATLPNDQYIYIGTYPDSCGQPGYDLLMMRWTMHDGYGYGGVTSAAPDINTNGVSNGGLTIEGTAGSLTAHFTPEVGPATTEPITLSGNRLTFALPVGANGMTTFVVSRGTQAQWDRMLRAYEKKASPQSSFC